MWARLLSLFAEFFISSREVTTCQNRGKDRVVIPFIRWDEKAVSAGCDTLLMIDALEAQWKGDRLWKARVVEKSINSMSGRWPS